MSPEEKVCELIRDGCTIYQYQHVQDERLRRKESFQKFNIPFLVQQESKLICEGEEILAAWATKILSV